MVCLVLLWLVCCYGLDFWYGLCLSCVAWWFLFRWMVVWVCLLSAVFDSVNRLLCLQCVFGWFADRLRWGFCLVFVAIWLCLGGIWLVGVAFGLCVAVVCGVGGWLCFDLVVCGWDFYVCGGCGLWF